MLNSYVNIYLLILLSCFCSPVLGQTDLSLNVGALLEQAGSAGIEKIYQEQFSLSLVGAYEFRIPIFREGFQYERTGSNFVLVGRYYPTPKRGGDGFGLGFFLRYRNRLFTAETVAEDVRLNRVVGGGMVNYKWVWGNMFLLNLGMGAGRKIFHQYSQNDFGRYLDRQISILKEIDLFFELGLGFRFGAK